MESIIRKWGNSPALRLPASVMKLAALDVEQKVNVTAVKGRITIEPMDTVTYSLEDLIAGISPRNSHGEVSVGRARGKEAL